MRSDGGRMISLEHDGVHHLLMIRGGSAPVVQLPHYEYIELYDEYWRTNEPQYIISSSKF